MKVIGRTGSRGQECLLKMKKKRTELFFTGYAGSCQVLR